MTRASGTVIAKDRSEPSPDAGLASRVVAAFQASSPRSRLAIETRRARRHRLWRVAIRASLPAAAAVLFFSVLLWPPAGQDVAPEAIRPTIVAPIVIEASTDAVKMAKRATNSLGQVIEISVDEVRQGFEAGLEKAGLERAGLERTWNPGSSFLDLLWEPFVGLLEPSEPESAEDADDREIVRF
jgi:hypothetical protein